MGPRNRVTSVGVARPFADRLPGTERRSLVPLGVAARAVVVHALWHRVGAFRFVSFWAFNHVRFAVAALGERSGP